MAATAQALIDARTGVEQFESRTADPAARHLCAAMVKHKIVELYVLVGKLEGRIEDSNYLARGDSPVIPHAEMASALQPGTAVRPFNPQPTTTNAPH
jgi:hypothetical protein